MGLDSCNFWQNVFIGAGGGAGASIVIIFLQYCKSTILECRDGERIYKWLLKETKDEEDKKYRSTRAIASWNNMTEDRVRYICSLHDKIYLSTGKEKDMWGVYGISERKSDG